MNKISYSFTSVNKIACVKYQLKG